LSAVGTDNLFQWCCPLLYSDHLPVERDPLAQLARDRARLMVHFVEQEYPNLVSLVRQARLVGSLSLLHNAYVDGAAELYHSLPVPNGVSKAILDEDGLLGDALRFTKSFERL
jgi:c-di-GMP-related signal transduction protein